MELKPDPNWKSLGLGELKSWIGCLIAMGLTSTIILVCIGSRLGYKKIFTFGRQLKDC